VRLNKTSKYSDFKRSKIEDYLRCLDTDLINLFLFTQNKVSFGIGSDGTRENISGEFQLFTSSANLGTQDTVAHSLGSIPIGYLVTKQNQNATLKIGGSTWTTSNAYFISSVTSTAYTVFLMK